MFKLIAFESGFKLERVKEFKNGVAREIVKMERA